MATTERLVTADELLDMPEVSCRYELVRGELRSRPFVRFPQAQVCTNILMHLYAYVTANGLGQVYPGNTGFTLELDPDHVRAPSVSFVRRAGVDAAGTNDGFFPAPPDVAFEVVSPDDGYMDVDERVGDYLEAGTLAVVVVNPRRRTVRVHRPRSDTVELAEADTLEVSDVVPGWRMPVREMFE